MNLVSVSNPGVAPPAPGRPGSSSRGVVYAPPGSCTHPSRRSMHRSSPRAATGSSRLMGGSPSLHSESISLGRRVGVMLSSEGSGGFRAGCPCGSGPEGRQRTLSTLASRLLLLCVVQLWYQTGSQVAREDAGPSREGWTSLGLTRGPRAGHFPRRGVPLREHRSWVSGPGPAWRARGPHSESCVLTARRAGSGLSR